MTMTANEALAEAWASIDGKLDAFRKERDGAKALGTIDRDAPGYTGHYEGYLAEAEEMRTRLLARGFAIIPITPSDEDVEAMARAMWTSMRAFRDSASAVLWKWEEAGSDAHRYWLDKARCAYAALVQKHGSAG